MSDKLRVLDPSNAPKKALDTLRQAIDEQGDVLSEVLVVGYKRDEYGRQVLCRWSSSPTALEALGMLQAAAIEFWSETAEDT